MNEVKNKMDAQLTQQIEQNNFFRNQRMREYEEELEIEKLNSRNNHSKLNLHFCNKN